MEVVLRRLHWKTVLIYLDDIIVFSKDFETHMERLAEVFTRLKAAGLKLKPSKCQLFGERVQYLGHVVSAQGGERDPVKVHAVAEWPVPKHRTDVRAFLGTCGYYRRFIADYSSVAKPLFQLSSPEHKFEWTTACHEAFTSLKKRLTQAPILAYPDYSKPFIVDTDASQVAMGAVLSQVHDGAERVVVYYSKTFTPEQSNYCVTRKELLAIVKALKHFRPHLYGRKFKVRTDHASLTWLLKTSTPSGQLGRWMETLAEFDFELEFRRGLKHNNADGLSRPVCQDCKQCARMAVVNIQPLEGLADYQSKCSEVRPVYNTLKEGSILDPATCAKGTSLLLALKDRLSFTHDKDLQITLDLRGRTCQVPICPVT